MAGRGSEILLYFGLHRHITSLAAHYGSTVSSKGCSSHWHPSLVNQPTKSYMLGTFRTYIRKPDLWDVPCDHICHRCTFHQRERSSGGTRNL